MTCKRAGQLGQRIWSNARDEYTARQGEGFSIKEFHKRSLDLGGVGLDTLAAHLRDLG